MDIEKLEIGRSIEIECRKGWKCLLEKTDEGFDVTLYNPTADGNGHKFYDVSTVDHPYGAPTIRQEPTLGIPCKQAGVAAEGMIVGALVLDSDGKITDRYSWSNIVYMKGQEFDISGDGRLIVDGQQKGFVQKLFLPDKNRMAGYVGVFGPQKPEKIMVIEMEDLLLSQ